MSDPFYTHALWQVRSGREPEFIEAWASVLAPAFIGVAPDAHGTLIRSLDDPARFYSFGPWPDLETMGAARASPAVDRALDVLRGLCDEARPGAYRVVLRIP